MAAPRPARAARSRRTVLAAAMLAPTLFATSLPGPALADSVTVPFGAHSARFSTPDASARLRSYAQSTTMQLRDNAPQTVEYSELDSLPRVRSGSLAFDAL